MSDPIGIEAIKYQDAVIFRINNTKSKNAITLEMVEYIKEKLEELRNNEEVKSIIFTGGSIFSSGGDIKAIYNAKINNDLTLIEKILYAQYSLNSIITSYPKKTIAIIDGLVVGGGLGLAMSCKHKVITEKGILWMPEVRIGFFPDAGAAYFLNEAGTTIANYMGIFGEQLSFELAYHYKLCNMYIPTMYIQKFINFIASGKNPNLFRKFKITDQHRKISQMEEMADIFSNEDCDPIINAVNSNQSKNIYLESCKKSFSLISPTSMKLAYHYLLYSKRYTVEQIRKADFYIATSVIMNFPDFIEGIKSMLIQKDKKPSWRPSTLSEVNQETLEELVHKAFNCAKEDLWISCSQGIMKI